jgi:CIC family chloride channel protein
MGDLHAPVLGAVVLGSATSWVVLRLMLGNHPLFAVPQYQLVHPLEFGIYAVLGVVGGLVSVAFTKLLLRMRERFLRMPAWTCWFQPVVGGLLAGLMGLFIPQVLGVGYGYVGDALNGRMMLSLMALLVVFKLLAVTTSYASGNAGGIFGPSLFIGAMLGGTIGSLAHHLFPAQTATPGAYALVGMGTLFAGVIRAPMTSVLMIFETTHDYAVIVPVMISNLVSFFISSRLQRQPIYDALAHQDGIHLPSVETRKASATRQVVEVMRQAGEVLSPEFTAREALDFLRNRGLRTWLVVGVEGVLGVISVAALERSVASGENKRLRDFFHGDAFSHVHPDHSLHLALERMGAAGVDVLPVVSRADVHLLLGIVQLQDVLHAFGVSNHGGDERAKTSDPQEKPSRK